MKNKTFAVGLVLAVALTTSGCGGVGSEEATDAAAPPPTDKDVTVSVWSNFSGRELEAVQEVLDKFHSEHPNITIENQGSQDDEKITQAIRGGNSPDIAVSFSTDNIGQFCGSGSFQDLAPYLERDEVDLEDIPETTRDYTSFEGTRCAMPLLADVYGLYYNEEMFQDAGIATPPKTLDELMQAAKKLTQFNDDGSIKVAGFVPTPGYYENTVQALAPYFGADWIDEEGSSVLASDPAWKEMLNWQKELTDFYGADNLTKFMAQSGQEYSPDNDFQAGRTAMILDGEYRTAFIEAEAPDLPYKTAAFPVAEANMYGTAYTTGTIVGVPKGAKNPGAAWEVIKYLTTDEDALVALANGIKNVPSSIAALDSPDLEAPPQFQTFLNLFEGGKLEHNPATSSGAAYLKPAQDFALKYVTGGAADLGAGLENVAKQIDDSASLGE